MYNMEKPISISRQDLEQLKTHLSEAMKIIEKYGLSDQLIPETPQLSKREQRINHYSELLDKKKPLKRPGKK